MQQKAEMGMAPEICCYKVTGGVRRATKDRKRYSCHRHESKNRVQVKSRCASSLKRPVAFQSPSSIGPDLTCRFAGTIMAGDGDDDKMVSKWRSSLNIVHCRAAVKLQSYF